MIKLNEIYEVDRKISKRDYIRYSPALTSTINAPNIQISLIIPSEGGVISLLNNYFDSNFEVMKKTDNSRYANGNVI